VLQLPQRGQLRAGAIVVNDEVMHDVATARFQGGEGAPRKKFVTVAEMLAVLG